MKTIELHGLGSGDCKAGFAVSAYAVKIASGVWLTAKQRSRYALQLR